MILTDGGNGIYAPCQYSCESLRRKGVTIAAVGVGPKVEVATLQKITAVSNDEKRVFLAKRFSDIAQFERDISNVACFSGMCLCTCL